MSHERYFIEDRMRVPFRNEEWHRLAGVENRHHEDAETVIIQEGDLQPDEVVQLIDRGAVFPLETAQPVKATFEQEPHI